MLYYDFMVEKRIKKIQEELRKKNCDAFLVTNPSNIFYLSGLKGAAEEREFLMIILKDGFRVITTRIYQAEIKKKIPQKNFIIAKERGSLFEEALKVLRKHQRIGFEKEDLKYDEYENLKENLGERRFLPLFRITEDLRRNKDREEIKIIKKAAEITDKTFYSILKIIKPGLTEKFIQRKLIETMEDLGVEGLSFEPIIASGKGSAEPHYSLSNRKITNNEILLIDMGAKYKGYCSDFTRTIFIGKAPERFRRLYNIVLGTQEMAIKKCRGGYSIKKLYQEAAENFRKYKEDKYFLHGLGHGVGIEIQESPNIAENSEGRFENGMVFTIEPGLYHKNFGGIRIEDLCLINEGCQVLSKATKELIEIK